MNHIKNNTFSNTVLRLDGCSWENCTFTNCEFETATGQFSLQDCNFKGCTLTIIPDSPASNVITLIQNLPITGQKPPEDKSSTKRW